jgi:hypothetical protein
VTTSARRFQQAGQVRQTLRNGWILLRDFLGADPARLAKIYDTGLDQDFPVAKNRSPRPRRSPDSTSDSLAAPSMPGDRF